MPFVLFFVLLYKGENINKMMDMRVVKHISTI